MRKGWRKRLGATSLALAVLGIVILVLAIVSIHSIRNWRWFDSSEMRAWFRTADFAFLGCEGFAIAGGLVAGGRLGRLAVAVSFGFLGTLVFLLGVLS